MYGYKRQVNLSYEAAVKKVREELAKARSRLYKLPA